MCTQSQITAEVGKGVSHGKTETRVNISREATEQELDQRTVMLELR